MREFPIGHIVVVRVTGVWTDHGYDMDYPFHAFMLYQYNLLGWEFVRGDFPLDNFGYMPHYRLKDEMKEKGYTVKRVVNPSDELLNRIGDIDSQHVFKRRWRGYRKPVIIRRA